MDVFIAVLIFVGTLCTVISLSLLGCWCYLIIFKLSKSGLRRPEAPVLVTSTTTTTAGGYPVTVEQTPGGGYQATPYPTTMQMPMPMATAVHSNQPYPAHPGPMPMPTGTPYPPTNPGFVPNVTPYPPAGPADSHMNPPSYDQVVASDSYGKQAPYNPNFTSH